MSPDSHFDNIIDDTTIEITALDSEITIQYDLDAIWPGTLLRSEKIIELNGNKTKVPLTPYQKIFYNEWQMNPGQSGYNLTSDQMVSGPIDIDRINRSMIQFTHHYFLANCSIINEDDNIFWVQRSSIPFNTQLVAYYPNKLTDEEILKEAQQPFDLENGHLIRLVIVKEATNYYRVLGIVHHILIDGLSCKTYFEEMMNYYNDSYHSHPVSIAEQKYLHVKLNNDLQKIIADNYEGMHQFWKQRLKGIEGEDFKFLQHALLNTNSSNGTIRNIISEYRFSMDELVFLKTKKLTRKYRLTPYIYGQMVFGILLHKFSKQNVIGVSFPVAILEGKDLMYGAHINSIIIDYRFERGTSVRALINQTLNYFEQLKSSKAKYLPVYEFMQHATDKNVLGAAFIQTDLKDIELTYAGTDNAVIRNDLNIDFANQLIFEQELSGNAINYRVRYNNETLDGELISNFINYYQKLFSDILEDLVQDRSDKKIADYSLLNEPQYKDVIEQTHHNTRSYHATKTIHQLFEEQVKRTPQNIALVYQGTRITYLELNHKANKLSAYLSATYELQPDKLVAICLNRTEYMLIAILAVLKTGAGYVPIDPLQPKDRISYILKDSDARVLLTDMAQQEVLSNTAQDLKIPLECVNSNTLQLALVDYDAENRTCETQPHHLFYIVYTSGTTGKPKGVMIEHRHVTPVIDAIRDAYNFDTAAKISAFTSFGFDVSSSEFLIALLYGNELHLLSEQVRVDTDKLSDYLLANEIEYAYMPPAILAGLPKKEYTHLKTIIYAGEPCDYETGLYWSSRKRLFNYYGPTETNIATGKRINNGDVHLIGCAVANATTYVLDDDLNPMPTGALGELYIGGPSIARGYLNQPELTAERFISNPFQSATDKVLDRNARLYKTGDLVRLLPNGHLVYMGRNDFQVKIRGYRIEPGEIEAKLMAYPGVKQAVVIAKNNIKTNTKYLIGYYTADLEIETNNLLAYLADHLPEYMVPSIVVHLDKLPINVNGKLDRKALPEPEFTNKDSYQQPENEQQQALCNIFAAVLGLEANEIGIDDDFFRLGGNSILSVKLTGRINQVMSVHLNASDIFHYKTIRKLAAYLLSGQGKAKPIVAANTDGQSEHVLSYAQERMWFLETYIGGTNTYNIPMVIRLTAEVSLESMTKAIRQVVNRHEVLRSFIKTTASGEGRQVVQDDVQYPLSIIHTAVSSRKDLDEALHRCSMHIFNLKAEYPILVNVFTLHETAENTVGFQTQEEVYISIVIHHIAFDGWSANIMMNEITSYYKYFEAIKSGNAATAASYMPSPMQLQYKNYAQWQRNYLTGSVLSEQLHFWKNKLDDCPSLTLATDKPRPQEISYSGANVAFALDMDRSNQLKAVAKQLEVSLYSLLLSGYYLMLHSYSYQNDIVIGTPIANRHHNGVQGTIGFFANTLALRQTICADYTLSEFIQKVGQSVAEAQSHQDLPFEQLVAAMDLPKDTSRHSLFQVMFGLQEFDFNQGEMGNELFNAYQPEGVYGYHPAKFDITTMLSNDGVIIAGTFNYAIDLFDEATIIGYTHTYEVILAQIAQLNITERKDKKISALQYLNAIDYQKIINEWNATGKTFPSDKTIQRLFEEQVSLTPDKIALVFEDTQLSYRVLNEKANQLATYIMDHYRIQTGDLIVLCLDRCTSMIIAMLAVLKTGGAYVPIDSLYPPERINYILDDCNAKLILTNEVHHSMLQYTIEDRAIDIESIDSIALQTKLDSIVSDNPVTAVTQDDLCYIIYTSGTTGNPKGVMITHKNLANLSINDWSYIEGAEHVGCYINYTFDAINMEIYPILLSGKRVCLFNAAQRKDLSQLLQFVRYNDITLLTLPPIVASELSNMDLSETPLNTLMTGGDTYAGKRYPGISYVNAYGPTEITVCSSYHIHTEKSTDINIGHAIANTTIYVLNNDLTPLPVGAIGELFIGGNGVAKGYLNRPQLTSERFIKNPFQSNTDKYLKQNDRLYKTGDLVRFLHNGELEFLGRNDFQVKINGYRIEPGEIESKMVTYTGIKQALVIAKNNISNNTKYLAAYYTAQHPIDQSDLISYLAEVVPGYMIPSVFISLDTFPMKLNGKLDKAALPEPEFTGRLSYQAPENETQHKLCEIYGAILGLDAAKISIEDDFFKLGGNSILSVKLLNYIHQAFDTQLNLAEIFTAKSLKNLSLKIASGNSKKPIISFNNSVDKQKLFMIHPGSNGCEVYVPLAEKLHDRFCCYGVDSYNLYHTNQITSLHVLAQYYLDCIDEIQSQTESKYAFLGWSLGGRIALEMAAILEQRGITDITVYLLDTLLYDDYLLNQKTDPTDEEIIQLMEIAGNTGVHGNDYSRFVRTESELSSQGITQILQHTQVTLFKAMQANEQQKGSRIFTLHSYIQQLPHNNIDRIVANTKQLKTLKIEDAHHWNILKKENQIVAEISERDVAENATT